MKVGLVWLILGAVLLLALAFFFFSAWASVGVLPVLAWTWKDNDPRKKYVGDFKTGFDKLNNGEKK